MKPDIRKASKIMGGSPINEVGSCFDSAYWQMMLAPDTPEDCKLVHGIGLANMPGQEGAVIGHAWLEFDNGKNAYDSTWGVFATADHYRRVLKASYVVEYTKAQALELAASSGVTGPWDDRILKAVNDKEAQCR